VVRTGYRMDWGGVRAEVDRSDLEGVEDIQKPAYVVGAGVADYIHFYCCQAPGKVSEVFNLLRDLQVKKRADERTRTAFLLITSDHSGVAGVCRNLQMPHIWCRGGRRQTVENKGRTWGVGSRPSLLFTPSVYATGRCHDRDGLRVFTIRTDMDRRVASDEETR
jgi:hypothetical protein